MAAVLVIKHGALGDFLQCLGGFAAIRRHHPATPITLLTTAPYQQLAEQTGYFDTVWVDERPSLVQLKSFLALRRRVRSAGFSHIYDLQNSDRTDLYFHTWYSGKDRQQLLWNGRTKGCSHPHRTPHRQSLHTLDRIKEQLEIAGIKDILPPSLAWMPPSSYETPPWQRYALLVPGGSGHRTDKRWTQEGYSAVARHLIGQGIIPVLIGTQVDADMITPIADAVPDAQNLMGTTQLHDIAALARHAEMAIGSDTGPMHLIAFSGCRCFVLFSQASNPKRCGQRGKDVTIIRKPYLDTLPPQDVINAL